MIAAAESWPPVPILMYHAVESRLRPLRYKHFYVLASELAAQMRALKREGYQPITFDALASALAGEGFLPQRPVLLTFDDGYANLADNVHPLLRDFGFPYTVFLVSGKVGETNDWVASEGFEPTRLLNWAQIQWMQEDGGVTFGSHTLSHPRLSRLPLPDARRELVESRDALEQHLQDTVRIFCYPYGDYSPAVVDAVREAGYTMAVTTDFGRVRRGDDPLRLPRVSVHHVPPLSLAYGPASLNFRWRIRSRKDERPLAAR